MAVTFSLITDTFLTETNLLNILRQTAPLMIVAVAMTFVITTAGIDLSVGSVLALVNALAAISLQAGLAWPLVIVLMLGVGIAIGLIQGFFIAYEGIPAFIVTLAGLSSIRGTALLLTKGYSIPIDPQSPFNAIGRGWIFGLPMPAIIAVVVLALGFLVFNETTFGRYVTGVGANAEAVRRAGVDTKKDHACGLRAERSSPRRSRESSSPAASEADPRTPAGASNSRSSPRLCWAERVCSAAAARCSARCWAR